MPMSPAPRLTTGMAPVTVGAKPAPAPSPAVRTTTTAPQTMAKSFGPKYYAKGGMTASKRADGIAQRGKTKGTMVMCGGGYTKGK